MIPRRKPLKRSTKPIPRKKRIPKVNPERKSKRRQSYAKGMAAYRKSETFKIVEARAGRKCEAMVPLNILDWHDGEVPCPCSRERGDRLNHHHETYARFGKGEEIPEDMKLLCDHHHAEEEAKHPTRSHGRG